MSETLLTGKRREILDFIAGQVRERGYPPSVREIGLAVGPCLDIDRAGPSQHAAEAGLPTA